MIQAFKTRRNIFVAPSKVLPAVCLYSSATVRNELEKEGKKELVDEGHAKQAPNREATWSTHQQSKLDIITKHPERFIQKDLNQQPRPYAAIELIAKEPIRYLSHEEGNIAVCDGNRGNTLQGHPKIFINLDQAKPNTCGYCGLRYAKEEFKDIIEKNEA